MTALRWVVFAIAVARLACGLAVGPVLRLFVDVPDTPIFGSRELWLIVAVVAWYVPRPLRG